MHSYLEGWNTSSKQYVKHRCDATHLDQFCFLFDLILYIPVNFSVMSVRVFLGWNSTKQGLMCLALGHNTVRSVLFDRITRIPRIGCVALQKQKSNKANSLSLYPLLKVLF